VVEALRFIIWGLESGRHPPQPSGQVASVICFTRFRVLGLGFRVQGLGLRFQVLGFRV